MFLFFHIVNIILNYFSYSKNLQGSYSNRLGQGQLNGKHFYGTKKSLLLIFSFPCW